MKPDAPFYEIPLVKRSGLTLVEIMIALTMTLIVLGAMMTAFQYASEQMQSGRALMELANRARSAESVLRSDLAHVTVDVRPYAQTAAPSGYFEYIEGRINDNTGVAGNLLAGENLIDSYLGDVDDMLAMTVRNPNRPFRGRRSVITPGAPPTVGPATVIESSLAEVVWFATWSDRDGDVTTINFDESVRIHRRALLIRPDLGVLLSDVNVTTANLFVANNDISVRLVPKNAGSTLFDIVANNLADLAVRRNRFCHDHFYNAGSDSFLPSVFPNNFDPLLAVARFGSQSEIMLTDATAFDLRVFSPNAPVQTASDIIIEPSDPGYGNFIPTSLDKGAFVDLSYQNTDDGWFSQRSYGNGYAFANNVYDTWTPFYESDGIDQDGDGLIDEGTDAIDNDNANGVDDTGERETLPPYPYPLRGLKISIRLVEKGTKQVHQTTIVQSFVPE